MIKYYVFYGHVTSDNYDDPDHHELINCKDKEEVLKLHTEWLDPEYTGNHKTCSNCVFRVIQGSEIKLVAKQKVIVYELKGDNDE